MSRPEYVKCATKGPIDGKIATRAWCGRTLETYEWCFVDITHALNSAAFGSRLLLCPECAEAICAATKRAASG
jgi:hypothetical protein